jgi:hypothetical protein
VPCKVVVGVEEPVGVVEHLAADEGELRGERAQRFRRCGDRVGFEADDVGEPSVLERAAATSTPLGLGAPPRLPGVTFTEKLSAYATAASSVSRSAGAATLKSGSALVDAVGRLVRAAVDRVLLSDDRVTSAADGKLRLSGQEGTEELADKVQRVVVLATPVVRAVARGAKFTRLPWALVASSSVSVGIAVRTGVREIQVLSSLVAYRIEQATGAPADPQLVEKVAVDIYLNPNRKPDLSDDRLRLVRLTRKWVLLGALGRKTSKRAGNALEAADKLDGSDLTARWNVLRHSDKPAPPAQEPPTRE